MADSMMKAIQIESFVKAKGASEEIIYPSKDLDPDLKLIPFPVGFAFENKGRLIGNYPLSLTYLYSFLYPAGIGNLPYLNFIFLFFILYLLQRKLNFDLFSLLLFTYGTLIFTQLVDLSEYPIFYLLIALSFIFFVEYIRNAKLSNLSLASLFCGLALWFRLEAALFALCFFIPIFFYKIKEKSYKPILEVFIAGFVFVFFVSGFFIFNYYDYGIFLGPRFVLNYAIQPTTNFHDTFFRFLTITFTSVRYGALSLGFFFFSPFLLYCFILSVLRWRSSDNLTKILMFATFLFIAGVGITAPSDGATITGRYLSLIAFPLVLLFHENKHHFSLLKYFKATTIVLNIWTLILGVLISVISVISAKEFFKAETYFASIQNSIVFVTPEYLSAGIGKNYYTKQIMVIRDKESLDIFKKLIQGNSIPSYTLVGAKKTYKPIAGIQYPENYIDEMKKISKESGRVCEDTQIQVNAIQTDCR